MTDGAEEEMPPSQSLRRRPTRPFQSTEARIDHPVDEDHFEMEGNTESRRLILNFAREQEEPVEPFWLNPFLLKHCIACACGDFF